MELDAASRDDFKIKLLEIEAHAEIGKREEGNDSLNVAMNKLQQIHGSDEYSVD